MSQNSLSAVFILYATLLSFWNSPTHATSQDVTPPSVLRGGQDKRSRTLVDTFRCDLCDDPSNQFSSVPPQLSSRIVTLTSLGEHHCGGLYTAALAGGIIQGQNQCNSVKAEFAPVCCNGNSGGVDGDPLTTTAAPEPVITSSPTAGPGPVVTSSPSASPVSTSAPTLADFGTSCSAVTNSTGNCGAGDRANGLCPDRSCCSQYGWCGTSPEHCNTDPLYLSGLVTSSGTDPQGGIDATIQSTSESP